MTKDREARLLGPWLTFALVIGGVIGSGIFLTAGQIAVSVRRPVAFLLVWIAGGIISLLACFAIAELSSMYPHAGGPYVYLREAYGDLPAFLYGWMILTVAQTGTIAALGAGFAQYLGLLIPGISTAPPLFTVFGYAFTWAKAIAALSIVAVTVMNIYGLKIGSHFVNVATWLKFLPMAGLIVFGLLLGHGDWSHFKGSVAGAPEGLGPIMIGLGAALVAVLFAYDGWVYITWVGSEIKDASRNLPLALVIGLLIVAGTYVLMNVTYLYALPLDAIMSSNAVVGDAASRLFSPQVGFWFAAVVATSVLGAMGSAVLCTARIFYAMAEDGLFFKKLAEVHPQHRTPAFSLAVQGGWSIVLVLIGKYDELFAYAIFMMIIGYIASVIGLFILRRKVPDHPRPYRCLGYPWVPAIYVIVATAWVLNTICTQPKESLGGLGIVLLGIPGYIYWSRQRVSTAKSR